jgi:hypothetical protein
MQGPCIKCGNTVYFNTELSMVALMHTKPEVAGYHVTAGMLQSVMKKALCITSRNWGERELVQPPWASDSKGRQNEWQNE